MIGKEKLRYKVTDTVLTCLCHMATGINLGIICQTLIDLERWTETTTEGVAAFFTWRGVGILFTCLTLNFVYNFFHHDLILGISVILCGLFTFVIPFTHSLLRVSIFIGLQGVPSGLVFIGNLLVLGSSWKNTGPFLQLMYLAYYIGVMGSQWLAKPFTKFITIVRPNDTEVLSYKHLVDVSHVNGLNWTNRVGTNDSMSGSLEYSNNSTMIVEAVDVKSTYMLTGTIVMVIGILTLCYVTHHCTWRQVFKKKLAPAEKAKHKEGATTFNTGLIVKTIMVVIILNFQFATESAYLGLLVTFVVRQLSWSKTMSMFIMSVLTIAGLAARAVAAVLAKWLPPKIILAFDITVNFVASVVLSIYVMHHPAVMWVCSVAVTMACATAGPAILAWASQEIPPSVKVNAAYMSTCATNLFLGPTVIAFFFHNFSPMWFCYLSVLYTFIVILLFIASIFIFRYINNRKFDGSLPGGESEVIDVKPTEDI